MPANLDHEWVTRDLLVLLFRNFGFEATMRGVFRALDEVRPVGQYETLLLGVVKAGIRKAFMAQRE